MPDSTQRIVLIGKDAIPGQVKTRLQPDISANNAAHIYKEIAIHICQTALETNIPVEISFRGDTCSTFAKKLKNLGCTLYVQTHYDLGSIIHRALHRADRVVAMGMDMPLITTTEIYDAMNRQEIVFGPAEDGGYWLIAAKKPIRRIFEDIDWSTDQVLAQSTQRCQDNNIAFSFASTHYDIDTGADLTRLLDDPLLPSSLHNRIHPYALS
ncbi:MAG: hypothetical protein CL916_05160 [Deltaproteobacteria bacterium]|nr:hypothetical protein [Deltaproteobacteria bacterium]